MIWVRLRPLDRMAWTEGGFAYLLSKNLQADLVLGAGFKSTPSRVFVGGGVSYRLDNHQDKIKPIEQ